MFSDATESVFSHTRDFFIAQNVTNSSDQLAMSIAMLTTQWTFQDNFQIDIIKNQLNNPYLLESSSMLFHLNWTHLETLAFIRFSGENQ